MFRFQVRTGPAEPWIVLCLAVTAVLASLAAGLADPPYATGDEAPHVDYAYQVWHGGLPVFEDGLRFRPSGAWLAPVQWTAQHPPLFYLLVAPLVGPLADAGQPVAAVYAARAVNALLHGALVGAAWWSARRLTRPGSTVPLLTALVVALMAQAARLGGSAYNDLLAAVLVTVLFGLCGSAVRRGLDARLVAAIALTAAACSLTRTSATIVAVVCCGVALLAQALRAWRARGSGTPGAWRPAVAMLVAAPAAVLAASGWFYLRNHRLTGNLTGSHFDWSLANQHRVPRTLGEILADPITWSRLPDLFWWGGPLPRGYAAVTMVVTVVVLVYAPVIAALVAVWWRRRAAARHGAAGPGADDGAAGRLLVALPVVAFGVTALVQLLYATNGGGLYPRYLLPVALPLALGVAAGLALAPRVLVPVWAAVVAVDGVVWVALRLLEPMDPGRYTSAPVPALVATALAVGVGAVSVAMARAEVVRANVVDPSTAATPTAAARASSNPA